MRAAIVGAAFLPFLWYAVRDGVFHFRGRRVSFAEHVLHVAIGLALTIVAANAVLGDTGRMLAGLLLFLVAGGLDEYVWHRDIPAVESDLHAKEHLALLIFVVVALAADWLEAHGWRLPRDLHEAVPSSAANPWWRRALVPALLAPYAWCGLHDNLHHFRHRCVPAAERIVHAAIVLAVVIVVANLLAGRPGIALAALVPFLVVRSLDEWIFHRGLPGDEVDRHAKTHLAFLGFVVATSAVDRFALLPPS